VLFRSIATTKQAEQAKTQLSLVEAEDRVKEVIVQRDALKQRLEATEAELGKLNDAWQQTERLQKEQSEKTSTSVDFISDLLRRAEADREQLRAELEDTKVNYAQKLGQLQLQQRDMEVAYEERLSKSENTFGRKLEGLKTEMRTAEDSHKLQVDRLKTDYETGLRSANHQTEKIFAELLQSDQSHKDQIEKIEAMHKKQIDSLQLELRQTEQSHKENNDRMRSNYETAEKLHKRQIENLRAELLSSEEARNDQLEKVEITHRRQLENLMADLVRAEEIQSSLKVENENLTAMSGKILELEKQRNVKMEESFSERMNVAIAAERRKWESSLNDQIAKFDDSVRQKAWLEQRIIELRNEVENLRSSDDSKLRLALDEAQKNVERYAATEKELRESLVALTLQNSAYVSQLRTLQQGSEKVNNEVNSEVQTKLESQVKVLQDRLVLIQNKRRSDFHAYQKRIARIMKKNSDNALVDDISGDKGLIDRSKSANTSPSVGTGSGFGAVADSYMDDLSFMPEFDEELDDSTSNFSQYSSGSGDIDEKSQNRR